MLRTLCQGHMDVWHLLDEAVHHPRHRRHSDLVSLRQDVALWRAVHHFQCLVETGHIEVNKFFTHRFSNYHPSYMHRYACSMPRSGTRTNANPDQSSIRPMLTPTSPHSDSLRPLYAVPPL